MVGRRAIHDKCVFSRLLGHTFGGGAFIYIISSRSGNRGSTNLGLGSRPGEWWAIGSCSGCLESVLSSHQVGREVSACIPRGLINSQFKPVEFWCVFVSECAHKSARVRGWLRANVDHEVVLESLVTHVSAALLLRPTFDPSTPNPSTFMHTLAPARPHRSRGRTAPAAPQARLASPAGRRPVPPEPYAWLRALPQPARPEPADRGKV